MEGQPAGAADGAAIAPAGPFAAEVLTLCEKARVFAEHAGRVGRVDADDVWLAHDCDVMVAGAAAELTDADEFPEYTDILDRAYRSDTVRLPPIDGTG